MASPKQTSSSSLLTRLLCCFRPSSYSSPTPTAREKGKAPCPRISTPPGPISGRCTSPPKAPVIPSPPSPALPPPRKSPSPVASLRVKLGLEERWMSPPAAEGRWWMEPGSRPYFPGRMRRREKKRLRELGDSGSGDGGGRPGTANSDGGWSMGRASGTTVGSDGSWVTVGGGPRKEVPKEVRRHLKGRMDGVRSSGGNKSVGSGRPEVKRNRSNSQGQQTKQWVKATVTDLPPIMGRIDRDTSGSPGPSPSSPLPIDTVEGLNVIREESPTPVWLAEERSRLLLERGKILLRLRTMRRGVEGAAEGDRETVREVEMELERVEERLRVVGEKVKGVNETEKGAGEGMSGTGRVRV
ncbi:hypothetical protein EV426DRAFT_366904 [Tirmania nivea]|nr:hypothetical protein EV426DRAFT_366904 [Tirmania nivea]